MHDLIFEWDEEKAVKNFQKHGVAFEEAITIFDDQFALWEFDIEHSVEEDREIIIGFSVKQRLLTTVYVERHEAIRIISARKATAAESRRYAEQN